MVSSTFPMVREEEGRKDDVTQIDSMPVDRNGLNEWDIIYIVMGIVNMRNVLIEKGRSRQEISDVCSCFLQMNIHALFQC